MNINIITTFDPGEDVYMIWENIIYKGKILAINAHITHLNNKTRLEISYRVFVIHPVSSGSYAPKNFQFDWAQNNLFKTLKKAQEHVHI